MNHRKTIGAGNIPRMIFIGGSGMLNYRNLFLFCSVISGN